MSLTANQIYEINHMNFTAFRINLGQLISDASDVLATEIAIAEGYIILGNSSGVSSHLDASGDTKLLIGNGTTIASFALSGAVTMTNGGAVSITQAEGNVLVGNNAGAGVVLDASGDTKLLIGNGTTIASYVLSGDVSMSNVGVVAVDSLTGSSGVVTSDARINFSDTTARGADAYAFGINFSPDDFFTGTAANKTYGLQVSSGRPVTSVMSGDSRDAIIKGSYSNYAVNDANSQLQGIGINIRNRSAGHFATMNACEMGCKTDSGATATNMYGGTFTVENYGTLATLAIGLKIDMRNEGTKATTEYGLLIHNSNNSIADACDAAIKITDAGANTGWDAGINLSGATFTDGTDIVLNSGITISSGTGAPSHNAPIGSMYIRAGQLQDNQLYFAEDAAGTWVLMAHMV